MLRPRLASLTPALALAGCAGVQSALDPAGPRAERIAEIWWVMFWGGCAVLTLVMALVLYTLRAAPRRTRPGTGMILGGGLVLPVLSLTLLLLYGYRVGALQERAADTRLSIEITGQRFWWRVAYPGSDVETGGELRIPVGEPVEIRLRSRDVIHSFWVPSLAGKLDAIPGRENRLWLQADRAGVYRGQCAEFCGAGHALMALVVVAEPRPRFEAWLAAQQAPARRLAGSGRFETAGCATCHTVRGTAANGEGGPDLTHIAGRWQRAAALAPGNAATLAEWIELSHWSVPESPARALDESALQELADYLEGLR